MMVLWLSMAMILPVIIGFGLVSCCWPELKANASWFWCQWWLAIGAGLGLASFTVFFTLLLVGSANLAVTFSTEILILVMVLGIRAFVNKARISPVTRDAEIPTPTASQVENTFSQILAIAFWVSLIFAIGMFILRSLENPHGESDAWTFWNARARLLFRTGPHWRQVFSTAGWSFPSYPLLTPMNILRFWVYLGKETCIGPAILAFLFTFATIGLLVAALVILRGRNQAFIGGLILASTPYFIKHGAAQYADVPLGFYLLATVVVFNLQDEVPEKASGMMCLAGMTAGLAAWAKDEGWLFLVSVIVARFLTRLIFRGKGISCGREVRSFLTGTFPILLSIAYFKLDIAPQHPSTASSQGISQIIARLTDFSRYLQTSKAFLRQLIEPYSLIYSTPIAIFCVYAIFLGLKLKQLKQPGVVTSLFTLGMMVWGYFFIYITTPLDLTWLLETTLTRLFLQLWPSTVFVFLMLIRNPEERSRQAELTLV